MSPKGMLRPYSFLLGLDRRTKRLIQVAADVVLLLASFLLALFLRYGASPFPLEPAVWLMLALVVPPTIFLFATLGFYRAIVRYVEDAAMRTVMIGVFASGVLMSVIIVFGQLPVPRSVPVIYMLLALFSIGGVRLMMRTTYRRSQYRRKVPVIIYGAGTSGRQLMVSLVRGPEYMPVAFVDDAKELQGADVGGVRVHNPKDLPTLVEATGARALLLALPSLSRRERSAVLDRIGPLSVQVRTVPGMADLVSGKAEVSDLREVAIEDLLGRDPVPPRDELMDANIRGKVVMVTGAGGSIGSELCRQILRAHPAVLVLFEVSEFMLYSIHAELQRQIETAGLQTQIQPILGSVCDGARIRDVLNAWGVQTLYHAAAYKHVPLVEHNVVEGLRNNSFGTATVAEAAVAAGVEAFILISTDKAVRPTNVMGASKRLAELVCQAWASRQSTTLFSIVRFGNVLGSSGSVIPLFRKQIAEGGPITVTHPEINRYFMTIPEAAQLVIQAGALAKGGDVFVLDMGEPVLIVELAQRMARLYGLKPVILPPGSPANAPINGDIAITFSALRPGEKLYEELLITSDAAPTAHPQIQTAHEIKLGWDELNRVLAALSQACTRGAIPEIKQLLMAASTGYVAADEVSDLVWIEQNWSDPLAVA
jgi:FlaA1/EpsC-like NDP-sugar epimerase